MQRLAFLFVLGLPVVCAAQLTGQFSFAFSNNLPVWDLSGPYARVEDDFEFSANLEHSPRGPLTGTAAARAREGFTDITASQTIAGRVRGFSGGLVRLEAAGEGQFNGVALGRPVSGPFKGELELVLDGTNRWLTGDVAAEFCLRGFGCRTIEREVNLVLPEELTGDWTLALDLGTTNNVVRGTASAQFASGRTLNFNVRGRFKPATGLSVLALRGTGAALGIRLPLTLDGSGAIQKLRGKLFGQKLVYP